MDNKTTLAGLLCIVGTINAWLLTKSWWSLVVLPCSIILQFVTEYFFGEEKAKDYYPLMLLIINIMMLPGAIKNLILLIAD